ncbi:hypothetical protein [Nocardioides pakistanensis]
MSRDDGDLHQYVARLERQLHQARCDLAAETERRQRAEARARAWRRVAQWIHHAHTHHDQT